MLPNFLIIGAPRCGTTWIDSNLRKHPQVFMPERKELHFFDREYDKGMAYYEEAFAGWSGQPAVGEATPAYIHGAYSDRDIPALIHAHLPDVRLIASLRNPVERVYSRFWNSKAKYDHNSSLEFEQKVSERPEFIAEGLYFEQLQRYYATFPSDRILILLYDDLQADPIAFMRRIYEFLGIDATFESGLENVRLNAASGKGHLARSRLLWLSNKVLERCGLNTAAERLRELNSLTLPPMRAETRRRLVDTYRHSNDRLAAMIGRDLSHWNL